ncbi:PREDICTED: F-box/FBD/LRR-repeat protein At1g13570-like [Ipomoea nil]|uniref:F-box/FBD/LRR-repeat protein At1g13570-like n=1 Tax=Ipomoea nil TaxID=35883 RepID=UPI000900E2BF|nr:PREDICTED: F-box/FBD/LRR-repeat protein At1g13570-like [Ipomoea nil]
MATKCDSSRDVISELPTDVKERILARLPTRQAARTAILSTGWRDVWLGLGQIVVDSDLLQCVRRCEGDRSVAFVNMINDILLCHPGPVKKFTLCPYLSGFKLKQSDFDRCAKQFTIALQLLKNSTNLCELEVKASYWTFLSDGIRLPEDCGCIIDQDLKMLHTLKIESFTGSTVEMFFVKMLLFKSPVLEKVVIQGSNDLNPSMALKISKELLRFPRASPKAEVVYMDYHLGYGVRDWLHCMV